MTPSGASPAMKAAAPMKEGKTNGNGAISSPHASEWNIGADEQPRQPRTQHARRDADDDGQLDRSPQWPETLAHGVGEVGVERDGPPQHVEDRSREDDGDRDPPRPAATAGAGSALEACAMDHRSRRLADRRRGRRHRSPHLMHGVRRARDRRIGCVRPGVATRPGVGDRVGDRHRDVVTGSMPGGPAARTTTGVLTPGAAIS